MPPASVTHLQARRRSSIAKATKSNHQQLLAPSRLTFYPNLTPSVYVSPGEDNVETDQPAASSGSALLFPPPATVSQSSGKPRHGPNHIKRPANAFMLFRADFVKRKHIPDSVEMKHKSLSGIIGAIWRELPAKDREEWERLAKHVEEDHRKRHPDYKFRPIHKKKGKEPSKSSGRKRGREADFDEPYASKRARAESLSSPADHHPNLEKSPPSSYPPGSFRFVYASLRDERQSFITHCFLKGIKRRPVPSLLGPLHVEGETPGEYLEDHAERWDTEKNYKYIQGQAEIEDHADREALTASLPSLTPMYPEVKQEPYTQSVPPGAHQPRMPRYRRTSSEPLPDEFVHHHPSSFPSSQAHAHTHFTSGHVSTPYPGQSYAGYHPQFSDPPPYNNDYHPAQAAYHHDTTDHVNVNYDYYHQGETYVNHDHSNWVNNVSPSSQPLPLSNSHTSQAVGYSTTSASPVVKPSDATSSIALPQLPSALQSTFPASMSNSQSFPTSSSQTTTHSSNQVHQVASASSGSVCHRYSGSGRSLVGRRASSAEPFLSSQYNSGAFPAYSEMSTWGHHVHRHSQSQEAYEHQYVDERDPVEEMEELEFDPSAVPGWNPNFSFGTATSSTSNSGGITSTTNQFSGNAPVAIPPHVISSPSPYVDTGVPAPYCESPKPPNLDMSCTPRDTFDPLGSAPSPVSTVSAASALSAASPLSAPGTGTFTHDTTTSQVHAPQPITPTQIRQIEQATMALGMNDGQSQSQSQDVTMEEDEDTKQQLGRGEHGEKVDDAQVFANLYKNLASSGSFYMGRMDSVPEYSREAIVMGSRFDIEATGQDTFGYVGGAIEEERH
ncbi:hypothetical protein D9758_016841 [Tetrapyrgos nigripes]|uniref:HMG box domain-containing protein n=1 Tax=Tetrapyrgos nigripes TaxID=182062 RepID=A0A8H5CA84_9AGAR|nr:hypothetical protein D9758_016841 [Tetrapyrgos nigripes]